MEWVILKSSGIHNKGLFAKVDIPKGIKVIEYVGEKITKKESDKRYDEQLSKSKKCAKEGAVYIFDLNKRYDLDGNVSWNLARYVNHSCCPNCETEQFDNHIWIVSTKAIRKGEEITYNYGYDMDDYEEHPCKCGSHNCIGFILDEKHWKKLKRN